MSAVIHLIPACRTVRPPQGPRTITLHTETITRVHGMLFMAVMRARHQLAAATSAAERELCEIDLEECVTVLDEFNQAVKG